MVQNQASGVWPNEGYVVEAGTGLNEFKRLAATENTDGSGPYIEMSYNRSPNQASPSAPANGATLHESSAGVQLSASATDPDGDTVQYLYRVSPSPDAETGAVWDSGWTTATTVTVPADRLPANRPYYWHVYVWDGVYQQNPDWVRSFTPTNTLPPAATAPGSPAQDQVIGSLTPTLSVSPATDAEGDPVQYWFRVSTGTDGSSGQVVSSGWQDGASWTVPSGVLKDGVPYTWSVSTRDRVPVWSTVPAPGQAKPDSTSSVFKFRVDLRQGLGKTVPSDSVGAVNVNLYNGNAVVSASSPTMKTAGGDIGVGFTYNSAKASENGLVGSYYDTLPPAKDFPAGDQPRLVRTDSAVSFNWGISSPYPPAVGADQFRVRWTGYLSVPATGTYLFGATHDDGIRVTVGGTTVLDLWKDAAVDSDFAGAVPIALTAGQPKTIVVDYYENGGGAQVNLLQKRTDVAQGDPAAQPSPVLSSWLSPNPPALPTGWSVSADLDGDGGYSGARITDAAVVLTDSTGTTHTYSKKSDGSYTPPTGEYGVIGRDGATGAISLADSDGKNYRFDAAGNVTAVTSAADDRKPAAATYIWSGTPARLTSITDPISNRTITLRYNGRDACPSPSNGNYDPNAPVHMLCQIAYPDGTTTDLFYTNTTLAAIIDPGNEITQFAYAGGVMTKYRDPLAVDWVAKDPATREGDATYSLIGYDQTNRVNHVQSPEPSGITATPTGRLGRSYNYAGVGTGSPTSTVTVDGGPNNTVTMDATGRPVTSTNAAGQTTKTDWSAKDLPLWTTDHTGRTTATVYDSMDRPVATWGPWLDSCFQNPSAAPGSGTPRPPVQSAACDQAMPHTTTGYDEGLTGLATAWWSNLTQSGAATGHSTTVPAAYGTTIPHSSLPAASGYSARFTGNLTLPAGTYSFAANAATIGDDGFRVFVDDRLAVSRWDTETQAIAADQPIGWWRLNATNTAQVGPALTSTNATAPGTSVNDNDPTPSTSLTGTGSFKLPDGYVRDLVNTAGSAPAVELWFKTTHAGGLFGYQNVNGTNDTPHVPALYVDTSGHLRGMFWGGTAQNMDSGVVVNDNKWHHAALTTSIPASSTDNTRTQTMYVDGVPVAATTGIIDMLTMTDATFGVAQTAYWDKGCPSLCYLTGQIADAALYGKPLGGDRVAARYTAGQPTFTSTSQGTGLTSKGVTTLDNNPHRIRVDYKNPTGASALTLTATPADANGTPTGSPITLDGTRLTPGYGLTTSTTTDDSGTITTTQAAPPTTSTTGYSDVATGIDPALGLATKSSVDPTGLNLTTTTTYESYGSTNSLLRPVTATPPSGAAAAVTTEWYRPINATPAELTRDNPCTTGITETLPQYGLAKATTNPTPATGSPVASEVIYDVMGRPVASGSRDGQPVPSLWSCTNYDTRGRTTQITVPAWGSAPARTVTTDYATGGDPLTSTVTDTAGTTTSTISTTVDLLGRTTSYRQSIPGTTATLTTTTTYNALGQTVSATTTSSAGGPTSTLGWTYLADGRANTTTLDGATLATISYDTTTKDVATVTYPTTGSTGVTLTLDQLTKDNAYRSTGQRWTIGISGANRTITDTLTRSRAGRIVQAGTADSANTGNSTSWDYTFDTASRLTKATLAATTTRTQALTLGYQYAGSGGCGTDPAAGLNGSRTGTTRQVGTGTVQTSTYCTDTASRLTEVKSTTGGTVIVPATVTYDAHGNATQLGNQKFSYDGANRVTSTRESSATPTQTLTYTRDSLGRVTKRTAGTTTGGDIAGDVLYGYTGADDSPDYQLTATGTLLERYLPLPGGALLTKQLTGAMTATLSLSSMHGDVLATLAGTTVTAGFVYEPFGQPLNNTTSAVDLTKTPTTRAGTGTTDAWHGGAQRGYEHTGGLNSTLMGARSYLPALGQFASMDPIPGGNTTSYIYPQDPVNANDLNGKWNSWLTGWMTNQAKSLWRSGPVQRLARSVVNVYAVVPYSKYFAAYHTNRWIANQSWGRSGAAMAVRSLLLSVQVKNLREDMQLDIWKTHHLTGVVESAWDEHITASFCPSQFSQYPGCGPGGTFYGFLPGAYRVNKMEHYDYA